MFEKIFLTVVGVVFGHFFKQGIEKLSTWKQKRRLTFTVTTEAREVAQQKKEVQSEPGPKPPKEKWTQTQRSLF